jgi:hypothetical protein
MPSGRLREPRGRDEEATGYGAKFFKLIRATREQRRSGGVPPGRPALRSAADQRLADADGSDPRQWINLAGLPESARRR